MEFESEDNSTQSGTVHSSATEEERVEAVPKTFTGVWATIHPHSARPGSQEYFYASTLGPVQDSKAPPNSHGPAAAVRNALRGAQTRLIASAATHKFTHCDKNKVTKGMSYLVLVLDPSDKEVSHLQHSFRCYEKGVLKNQRVRVEGLRRSVHHADSARKRDACTPPQYFRDQKVDCVIMNDCAYYYSPVSLFTMLEPYLRTTGKYKTVVYATIKPILCAAPGYYEEEFKYSFEEPSPVEDEPPIERKGTILGGSAFVYLNASGEEEVVFCASTQKPDSVYRHPVPRWYFDNESIAADAHHRWVLHCERSLDYHVMMTLVASQAPYAPPVPAGMSRMGQGTVVNAGICVKAMPGIKGHATRVDPHNHNSIQAYHQKVALAVALAMPNYTKYHVSVEDGRFLDEVVRITAEQAWVQITGSLPRFVRADSHPEVAEEYRKRSFQHQGVPATLAESFAILSRSPGSRIEGAINTVRAAAVTGYGLWRWVSNIAPDRPRLREPEEVPPKEKGEYEPITVPVYEELNLLSAGLRAAQKAFGLYNKIEGLVSRVLTTAAMRPAQKALESVHRFAQAHPNGDMFVSGLLAGFAGTSAAMAEELFKRATFFSVLTGTGNVPLALLAGMSLPLLEAVLEAYIADGWDQKLAAFFYKLVVHFGLFFFLPYVPAVVIHSVLNGLVSLERVLSGQSLGAVIASLHDKQILAPHPWVAQEMEIVSPDQNMRFIDNLGRDVTDGIAEVLPIWCHEVNTDKSSIVVFQSDMSSALQRPATGVAAILKISRTRLDEPVPPPHHNYWAQNVGYFRELFPDAWRFYMWDISETEKYLRSRPWPLPWIEKRVAELRESHMGGGRMKQKLFPKSDEKLPVKSSAGDVKTRPIFPPPTAVMSDFRWQPPLKDACSEPLRSAFSCLDGTLVQISVVFVTRPQSDRLTEMAKDFFTTDVTLVFSGDDMILIMRTVGEKGPMLMALAIDLRSCDLSCGLEYQEAFVEWTKDRHLCRDEELNQILATHLQAHLQPVHAEPQELEEWGMHLERPSQKCTQTGEPATALKAGATWALQSARLIHDLHRYPLNGPEEVLTVLPQRLLECIRMGGMLPEPEIDYTDDADGRLVMPIERATFLSGSWVHTAQGLVWAPLKAIKAFYAPTALSGTHYDIAQKWMAIQLHDQLSILPFREVLRALCRLDRNQVAAALKEWQEHQMRVKAYTEREPDEPHYTITWDEWEMQIRILCLKVANKPAAEMVSSCMEELRSWVTQPPTWPYTLRQSMAPLFIARFGKAPVTGAM